MPDNNFMFSPENVVEARTYTEKAISFVNHLSFNLRDKDVVAVYSDFAVITRHETGKMGLYRADNGIPILADVFDTIEIKHSTRQSNKYPNDSDGARVRYFEVCYDGMYGAYDENGLQVVPVRYKSGITYAGRCFIVTDAKSNLMGVYDNKGNLVAPVEYRYVTVKYGIITGIKKVGIANKTFAFNIRGKSLFFKEFEFHEAKGFDRIEVLEEHIIVKENGLESLFTHKGENILPIKCKWVDVHGEYAIVENELGKYGCFSLDGKNIVPCEYDKIVCFGDNYIKGRYGNTECLFYKDGHIVVEKGVYCRIIKTSYGAKATTLKSNNTFNLELCKYIVKNL